MNAFGKKSGLSAGRPSFGVAGPMRGSGMVPAPQQPVLQPQPDYMQPAGSGAQFPTLEKVRTFCDPTVVSDGEQVAAKAGVATKVRQLARSENASNLLITVLASHSRLP